MRHHCLARSKFLCCKFSKNVTSCLKQTDSIFTLIFSSIFPVSVPLPSQSLSLGLHFHLPDSTLSASYHMCPDAPTPSPPFPPASLSFFPSYYLHPHSPYSHTLTNMNGSDPPIRMYGFFPPSYSTSVILPMYIHFP